MTGRWRRRFLFSTSRDSTLSPRMTTPKEGYLVSVISSDCLIIFCSSFMLQTCTFVQVFFLSIFSRIKVRPGSLRNIQKTGKCVFYETESFRLDKEGPAPASLYRHPVSRGWDFRQKRRKRREGMLSRSRNAGTAAHGKSAFSAGLCRCIRRAAAA